MTKTYTLITHTLIIGLFIGLQSCYRKRDYMYHFTKHDSTYFNAYDTLKPYYFKTNTGTDVLYLTSKKIREDYCQWYWDNNVESSVFNASFSCKGYFIHKYVAKRFWLFYFKESDNDDPTMTIYIGERQAHRIHDERNLQSNGIYKDNIIIDYKNSKMHDEEEMCKYHFDYIKWNKYKGIVEYKLSDGTFYKEGVTNKVPKNNR